MMWWYLGDRGKIVSVSSRLAWSARQVSGQPGLLHRETLSQKPKRKRERERERERNAEVVIRKGILKCAPSEWPVTMSVGIVLIHDWCGRDQTPLGGAIPELVVLGYITKQTGKPWNASQYRTSLHCLWFNFSPPGSCLDFLSWFLSMTDYNL